MIPGGAVVRPGERIDVIQLRNPTAARSRWMRYLREASGPGCACPRRRRFGAGLHPVLPEDAQKAGGVRTRVRPPAPRATRPPSVCWKRYPWAGGGRTVARIRSDRGGAAEPEPASRRGGENPPESAQAIAVLTDGRVCDLEIVTKDWRVEHPGLDRRQDAQTTRPGRRGSWSKWLPPPDSQPGDPAESPCQVRCRPSAEA